MRLYTEDVSVVNMPLRTVRRENPVEQPLGHSDRAVDQIPLQPEPTGALAKDVAEGPEVIQCGAARLIGRDPQHLLAEATELLTDREACVAMLTRKNPYGDGRAAEYIVAAASCFLRGLPIEERYASDAAKGNGRGGHRR